MPDLQIHYGGSVCGFEPLSPAARDWLDENVESEGWQWLGNILWVDDRFGGDLQWGAEDAGLVIA